MDDYGSDFESDSSGTEKKESSKYQQNGQTLGSGETASDHEGDSETEPTLYSEAEDAADGSATAEEEASDDGDDAAEDGGAAGPGRGSTVSGCTSPNGGSAENGHDDPLRPTRRRLRSYLLKGRRAYRRRQGARAVAHFVRAMALSRLVHGDRHWRTLRCQVLLARAYLDLQELPAQAEEHASEALTITLMYQGTELIPDDKRQVLHMQLLARLVRGQALVQLGQPAAAEECLHRAEALIGPHSRQVAPPVGRAAAAETADLQLRLHTWLGRAGAARGRLEPARAHLSAALELRRQRGELRDAAGLLRELGTLELRGARRRSAELAVQWLQQALRTSQQCWGADSAEHLDCEGALRRAEHRLPEPDLGELTAAVSRLRRRCTTALGAAHPTTLRAGDHLVQLHSEQQYHEKATRECRANTKAKIAAHGELSREVTDGLRTLSQLYVSAGEPARAHEVARRWWAIESLMHGARDRRAQAAEEAVRQLERQLGVGNNSRGRLRSAASSAPSAPSLDDSLHL